MTTVFNTTEIDMNSIILRFVNACKIQRFPNLEFLTNYGLLLWHR